MQYYSRMPAPLARPICLLVAFCLLSGCNSHSTEEAKSGASGQPSDAAAPSNGASSGAAVVHDLMPPKTAESSAAEKSRRKSQEREMAAVAPAAGRTSDDDRYAQVAALPAVGSSVPNSPHDSAHAALSSPPAGSIAPPPATAMPAEPRVALADPVPSGNPLRGDHPSSSDRPQDPPAPEPTPPTADTLPPQGTGPTSAGPRPGAKSELTIPTTPEPTAPATPVPAGPMPAGPAPVTPTVPLTPEAPATPVKDAKPPADNHAADTARPGPRTNKNSGVPFDWLKENGPIFLDMPSKTPWPTPKLALVITGQQMGYLEPCGCAGLDRMKGGMSRRYSLFRMLRDKGWPVIGLDAGGTAKGFGKQAEIKFQIAVNAMNAMRYNSAALGKSDLQLPAEEVLSQTMPANAQAKTMFVCANVGLFSFNEAMLPRTQLVSTTYKMIGVTSIVGKKYLKELAGNSDLKQMPAEQVLNEAVPLLKSRANYMVLLAHATRDEAIELGKKYPTFNLVVCAGEPGFSGAEPPSTPEEIKESGAKLIEVGEKGMYAVVIGLYDDPNHPLRYQRVTLDSRFPSSPEMVALMGAYQEQLKDMGLSGLGIRPLPHPLAATNGKYLGSEACASCHEESYRVWKKTPHSHAFATLKQAIPPRNFDPECIACHTVGWNTQKFFPYESGYLNEKETPHLTNVGCEDCHGPGEKHVEAENHGTAAQQVAGRKTVVLTEEEASNPNSPKQNCWTCHDLDNSPEFKFNLYFPFVKHNERE